MERTITPAEMRTLEADFMARCGVAPALLMEHAAQGVCDALARRCPGGRALFLCGGGNNGGDGYAAARLWQARGGKAVVMALPDEPRGDALMNRTLAQLRGIPLSIAAEGCALPPCDIIVDALFGTGLDRPVEGLAGEIIRLVNRSGKPVIAVDIPSGLDGLTGRVLGDAIRATQTVTFHRIKRGLVLGDGAVHTGALTVHPILIPKDFGTREGWAVMEPGDLKLIPPRPADSHKGSFGRVAIFAGSRGMAGAAAFAANACVKAGAGLTTLLCRESLLPMLQVLSPGAVCLPLPEQDGRLTCEAAGIIRQALLTADAAAAGCGLGQSDDVPPLLTLFRDAGCPVVWDADALNLLAATPSLLPLGPKAVITPHPGEAARLLGCTTADILADMPAALSALRQRTGAMVLLKGARTLMTDGDHTAVNRYGSPALAKGGSGDILTGVLAALLARRLPCSPLETIQLGALIHGLTGIRAARRFGESCATPQALVGMLRLDDKDLPPFSGCL